jgi:hypothetical protein
LLGAYWNKIPHFIQKIYERGIIELVKSFPFLQSTFFPLALKPFIVFLASIGIIYLQFSQLAKLEAHTHKLQNEQAYQLEELKTRQNLDVLTKLPRSNFRNLVADWTYLSFLQYFGDVDAREKIGTRLAPNFFDVAVHQDPLFLEMYPYLSASVTLYAGKPERTVQLLEKAAQAMPTEIQPKAYFLWQAKGTDELLFLGRNQAAKDSYEMAANWAERSSDPTTKIIAERSRQTAQFLAANPDSRRARVGAWFNVLTSAVDNTARQLAQQQIHRLGGEISVLSNGAFQVRLPKSDQ